jgi:predicted HTH transcriptional regulator
VDGKRVAILEVPAASHAPIRFQEHEYIRIGSYKKKLREFTEKERALWAKLAAASFESGIAANSLTPGEALQTLAVPKFFELLKQPAPSTEAATIDRLVEYKILARTPTPLVDVTNLGALLIGTDLNRFGLARKGVR